MDGETPKERIPLPLMVLDYIAFTICAVGGASLGIGFVIGVFRYLLKGIRSVGLDIVANVGKDTATDVTIIVLAAASAWVVMRWKHINKPSHIQQYAIINKMLLPVDYAAFVIVFVGILFVIVSSACLYLLVGGLHVDWHMLCWLLTSTGGTIGVLVFVVAVIWAYNRRKEQIKRKLKLKSPPYDGGFRGRDTNS
jgi:hypothetical protein